MELTSLKDALHEELKDLYSAEQQLAQVLPKMAEAATNAQLASAFTRHLEETQGHVARLEQAFGLLGEKAEAHTCQAMKGLLKEGQEIMSEDAEPEVLDALLIAAAQKVEHYEIASYGTVCSWADQMGFKDIKDLLGQTLEEEEATDKKLTKLAESVINVKAE
ncbi:MAG TPA: ferritin-like domain-containing protein [Abditibacteriaceae bacterium]|jgi:ferritin-like metal-binding protein YciE